MKYPTKYAENKAPKTNPVNKKDKSLLKRYERIEYFRF
jgi:hypothetical protein